MARTRPTTKVCMAKVVGFPRAGVLEDEVSELKVTVTVQTS